MTSWTVPNDDFYNYLGGLIGTDGTIYYVGNTIPAGTRLSASDGLLFEAGIPLPGVATTLVSNGMPGAPAASAAATMLAAGTSSRVAAPGCRRRPYRRGPARLADRARAQRRRQSDLNDPSYNASLNGTLQRAAHRHRQSRIAGRRQLQRGHALRRLHAGTQAAPILAADGSNPYDIIAMRGAGLHAWYPEHGGDLLLMAQQDVTGRVQIADNNSRYVDSDLSGNWLRRQGGGASADPTAWWINFGSLTQTASWKVDSLDDRLPGSAPWAAAT